MTSSEKPGAQTPWKEINQLLAPDERFVLHSSEGNRFILAPKQSSCLAALLYLLQQQEIAFVVRGRGTTPLPFSSPSLIISARAFSHVVLHEQGVVQVGAGCSLFDLHQFLLERKQEIALEGDPLASLKRSVGGVLLSGKTAGIHYRQERLPETILGLEFVTWQGDQIQWGGFHRSPVAGPALHQLMWGFNLFPGVIVKIFLKTYSLPHVRLRLAWSFRQKDELLEHVFKLKNFSASWENLEYVVSGNPTDQCFVFAQLSGLQEEMEAFSRLCPHYVTARQQGERVDLKNFLRQQRGHVHLATHGQLLKPGEYLWSQELEQRAWWLTACSVEEKASVVPVWKQRLYNSLCPTLKTQEV